MQPTEGTDTACAALYRYFLLIYNGKLYCFELIVFSSWLLAFYERYDQVYGFPAEQLSCKTWLLNKISIVSINCCQLPRGLSVHFKYEA